MQFNIFKWRMLSMVAIMLLLLVGTVSVAGMVLPGSAVQAASDMPSATGARGAESQHAYIMASQYRGVNAQTLSDNTTNTTQGNFGGLNDVATFGNVGIGTPYDPTLYRPLLVYGNAPIFSRDADSAGIIFRRSANQRWVFGVNDTDQYGHGFVISSYPESSTSGSIARMFMTLDGRVGINTVAPDNTAKLTVVNDNATFPDQAVYGRTQSGNTFGVGGTNDQLNSLGYVGGSVVQSSTTYGVGAFGQYNGTSSNSPSGSLGNAISGVYGNQGYGTYAGYFNGDVNITGALTSGVKDFKIDDPLDPNNKYLIHSSVESPDMKTFYDGATVLDANGQATVSLPAYFGALNRDFRYQLTCIGAYAPVFISQEISNNQFKIAGGTSGLKVSWQVTGIRNDPYAQAHPIVVEQDKPASEKGTLLYSQSGQTQTTAGGKGTLWHNMASAMPK